MTGETPRAATRRVIRAVADAFNVDVNMIVTPRRLRPIAAARQMCMALMVDGFDRDSRPRSLPKVGRIFRRDHTTVLHGVRCYRRLCAELGLPRRPDDLTSQAALLALHLGYVSQAHVAALLASPVRGEAATSEPLEAACAVPEPATRCEPIPTIVDPPKPEPETPRMLAVIPTLPPQLSNGCDFGSFDIASWRSLPDAMRREGVLLFLTRDEIERPNSPEDARIMRAASAFGMRADALDELMAGRQTHDLEAGRVAPDTLLEPRVPVDPRGTAMDGFLDFTRDRVVPASHGRVVVPELFAAYAAHARFADFDLMTRASFGSALRSLAKGAPRIGAVQYGLRVED